MDPADGLILAIILFTLVLLLFFVLRIRGGSNYGLRSLSFPAGLRQQIDRSAESGGSLHVTLGRGALTGVDGPAGATALLLQDNLTDQSGKRQVPTLVSSGDGTLFVAGRAAAQSSSADGGDRAAGSYESLFLAPADSPMTYAGGVGWLLNDERTAIVTAVGKFGTELGIILEAAAQVEARQFVGVDDPVAMAVAEAATDNVLLGEELFAAPAYFGRSQVRLAGLRAQDALRWLAAGTIILFVVLQLLGVL